MKRKSIFEIRHHYLTLENIIKENHETYTFEFSFPEGEDWGGGDHAHFVIPNEEVNEKTVRHLSVTSLPIEKKVSFATKFRGEVSYFKKWLLERKIGDKILMAAFAGQFRIIRDNTPLVFISQGVSIATIYSLVKEFENDRKGIPNITSLSIDSTNEYIYEDYFNGLNKLHNFNHSFVNKREVFYENLDKIISFDKNAYYYVVGSREFIDYITLYLTERSVSKVITDTHNNNHPYKVSRVYE